MTAKRKTAKRGAVPRAKNPTEKPARPGLPSHLVPGNPGNSGGKPGRSGRKPDAFREELAAVRDAAGLAVLEQVLGGELSYTLTGKCEHCGKASKGKAADVRLAATPDTRLRAAELTMKHTLPIEKTIRLEGVEGVNRALDRIKERIRANLPAEQSAALIADIHEALQSL